MVYDSEKDYRRDKWNRKKAHKVKENKDHQGPRKSVYGDEDVDLYEDIEETVDNKHNCE